MERVCDSMRWICEVEERCESVKGMRMRQGGRLGWSPLREIEDTRILKRIEGQKDKQRREERGS